MVFAIAVNAALLTKLWERDLLARRLEGLGAVVAAVQTQAPASLEGVGQPLDRLLAALSPPWAAVAVYDSTGSLKGCSGPSAGSASASEVLEAMAAADPITRLKGESGLFFSSWGRQLEVMAPLRIEGRVVGAVRAVSPLEGLRFSPWASWQLIVLFVLLDGGVIALFGSYLLRRRVVGPVERMAAAAASYRPGGAVPVLSDVQGAGEIGSLARGLEAMFAGLEEAAKEREDYVRRLEQAMHHLKAAQEEVIRSEKLAVVGQLAAGVAHEIGNPIASILGYTELLLERGPKDDAARDSLSRIKGEVERIDRIVRGLLDFARPVHRQIEDVDVNPVVREALDLVCHRKGVKGRVRVEAALAEGLPKVAADRGQLTQVFVNLMLNAVDAMAEGGTLTLATRTAELAAEEVEALNGFARRRDDPPGESFARLRAHTSAARPAAFVVVEVADTGGGIAEADLPRIFDPFYTTKPPGEGTGLGLAISLRIARSFGGSIRASRRPQGGALFQVLLPVRNEAAGQVRRQEAANG
jgi:signal transduction histidine kinase